MRERTYLKNKEERTWNAVVFVAGSHASNRNTPYSGAVAACEAGTVGGGICTSKQSWPDGAIGTSVAIVNVKSSRLRGTRARV